MHTRATAPGGEEPADVVVVVAHDGLRALVVQLLGRHCPAWRLHASGDSRAALDSLGAATPDLAIVAAGDVARCCRTTVDAVLPERVIVIVPEPDAGYDGAARDAGLAGSLPADRIGDDLLPLATGTLDRRRGPS